MIKLSCNTTVHVAGRKRWTFDELSRGVGEWAITLKMVDQGRSDFCVVLSLRTCIKIDVNKFAISAHMVSKLSRQALKS